MPGKLIIINTLMNYELFGSKFHFDFDFWLAISVFGLRAVSGQFEVTKRELLFLYRS